MPISRRNFLKSGLSGLTFFTTASSVPLWVSKSAEALCNAHPDRILVIVQQAGGNDGLNTVIPYTDPIYTGETLVKGKEVRPNLKILEPALTNSMLGDGLNAFHPRLVRLKNWWSNGDVAIVQNVGYPNSSRSHFVATDYWERGMSPGSDSQPQSGWISRYLDNDCSGVDPNTMYPLTMVGAGRPVTPLSLIGEHAYTPPAINKFSDFGFDAPNNSSGDHQLAYIDSINKLGTVDSNIDFVQRTANLVQASMDDLAVAEQVPTIHSYPSGNLGDGLEISSKIIRAGFGTRLFYVHQGGYDTHANQFKDGGNPATTGRHPKLLIEFDKAIDAFMKEMVNSGNDHRVMILTFSEFGRQLIENGSEGTDHGSGNCLFMIGRGLNGGVYGGQPDLVNLERKAIRHTIDFRAVFASVIQDWYQSDPEPIFGTQDFNDPQFDFQGGMAQLSAVVDNGGVGAAMPASNGFGALAGAALTAAAGAWAINRLNRDHEPVPEITTSDAE
jgi:uncharacterized protein (DUF1501 family)